MSEADRKIVSALVPAAKGAVLCEKDGVCRLAGSGEARDLFASGDVLLANAVFVSGRLRAPLTRMPFDILELFAFVHPGVPCLPSAGGVASALGLPVPHSDLEKAASLWTSARKLFADIAVAPEEDRRQMQVLAFALAKSWRWSQVVAGILGTPERKMAPLAGFDVWKRLPHWEDEAPPGPPTAQPVTAAEARARLQRLVGEGGEARPEQYAFADAAVGAFAPRQNAGAPHMVLIEAGTGTGKTLGYLAPASLWAEKNGPGLWISTYTRNLQRQIWQEIGKLYPDPAVRAAKAVVRKGRENYLCLLNFEEAVKRSAALGGPRQVALALIARWVAATDDGDVSGAGFPAFLAAMLPLRDICDRRGECIYAGCLHYRSCFIERVLRRARRAEIVVANHALVIARTAQEAAEAGDAALDDGSERGTRFVFDEGHHLFDAADSGFSASLSGREMAELRRWLRGPEGRMSRARGLEERLKDFVADDTDARDRLEEAAAAAGVLAGEGFLRRMGAPGGPGEAFLASVYAQVRALSTEKDGYYSLECEPLPADESLLAAAAALEAGLRRIGGALAALAKHLRRRLDDKSDELDPAERLRLQSHIRGLERRAHGVVADWIAMLGTLTAGEIPDDVVDWFEIAREDGRDGDVAMRRHWIDPSQPFADAVLTQAHGALIASATLRDTASADEGDEAADWRSAEMRTGASHLPLPPSRFSFGSPFDYAAQAKIFVVRDVDRRDPAQMAAAYRELFKAAGGGALGLFTAVRNLKAVASRIFAPLAEAGLTLYAQHIDRLDTGALVDLFRSEENSCLLGTDALRDGVDVPGNSLRLVVFDKVPWPRPTILHKARRARFGKGYDDLLTRLRLKQAFGRLIRSATDKGCFVILESATPSRLLAALPAECELRRCGLAEAINEIRQFLQPEGPMKEVTGENSPAITAP